MKTAFKCHKCGGNVEARNALAFKLLMGGKPAICDDCLDSMRGNGQIDYASYYDSPQWKALAKACKKRAGWRCQLCNAGPPLEAHHRDYVRFGHEIIDDLTALCPSCHDLVTAYQRGLIEIPEFDREDVRVNGRMRSG